LFLDFIQLFLLYLHLFLKISIFNLQFTAQPAPYRKRLVAPIRWMFQVQRAILLSLAFVSLGALPIVTVHAVVVPPATVIGGYVAAEVTFVLDVSFFMGLTISDAEAVVLVLPEKFTFWTLHRLELCSSSEHPNRISCFHFCILLFLQSPHIIIIPTCPQTTKIRPSTRLTLEVVEVINSKLFKIIEVLTLRILQPLIQV
jgi:hypothetical protein